MIPILYDKSAVNFSNNGIGFLVDIMSNETTEERNGVYETVFTYPTTGALYEYITEGAIIKCKANETSDLQLFRIYKHSKPLNGIVTFNAEHISYDAGGIPVAGFNISSATAQMAINRAIHESPIVSKFTAWSDISTLNSTNITTPCSLRAILGGQTGSVLDVWGGEYEFDNYTIKLHAHRGEDTGVIIAYGKNLTDVKQERNISECYTCLMPFAIVKDENDAETLITLKEKVLPLINAENIGHERACIVDLSSEFEDGETVTESTLLSKAQSYINSHDLGTPKISITTSFVNLWQTEEYKDIAPLERVRLCDTVTIRFLKLGINAKSKVIKTVYDGLSEKYKSIELGDAKSNFANTIIKQNDALKNLTTFVQKGLANATETFKETIKTVTNLITGNSGGYVVLHPAEQPQEILILDTPDIESAMRVWRWNSSGLGYSKNGYNGDYGLAITMDGQIVADFITAGTLDGGLLRADSVNANAISQEFKKEISDSISETKSTIEQEFKAADEMLSSRITTSYIDAIAESENKTITLIEQTADNISLEVSKKYSTQTELTQAVNGIQIGGKNLYKGTGNFNSNYWKVPAKAVYELNSDYYQAEIHSNDYSSSTSVYCTTASQGFDFRDISKIWTVSAMFKGTIDNQTIGITLDAVRNGYEPKAVPKDVWTKISWTFQGKTSLQTFRFSGGVGVTADNPIYVAQIKVEEGNKATDWTPAPEDVDSSIATVNEKFSSYSTTEEMNSAIELATDNITLEVSKKYATQTELSTAEQRINGNTDEKLTSYSTTTEMKAAINATADSITSTVSKTYATQTTVNGIQSTMNTMQSSITQNANNINLKVSKANLVSEINQSAGTITLNSNRLVINSDNFKLTSNGTVTASNVELDGSLKTTSADNTFYTYIHAGVIETFYNSKRVAYIEPVFNTTDNICQYAILGSGNYDGVAIGAIWDNSLQTYYRCNINNAETAEGCRHHFIGDIKFENGKFKSFVDFESNYGLKWGGNTGLRYISSGMYGAGLYLGISANSCDTYLYCGGSTNIRSNGGDTNIYAGSGKAIKLHSVTYVYSNLIMENGYIDIANNYGITCGGNIAFRWYSNALYCGIDTATLRLVGSNIYANSTTISTTSDERKKTEITPLSEKYLQLIKSIKPVSFKYTNDISLSGRTHTGFIAQNVLSEMEKAGINTSEFAAFVDIDNNGEEYALRYDEFIALLLLYIKHIENRLENLEKAG